MTTCPQCGTETAFKTKRRTVERGVEDYIRCSACPYESVIRWGPTELLDLEIDVDKLRGKVEAGATHLVEVLRRREKRLADLRLQIEQDEG